MCPELAEKGFFMRSLIAPVAHSLAVFAVVFALVAPAQAQVIDVEPMSHDFGEMQQQETLTTTVKVTNTGAGLLQIENVEADCGCTIPTLEKYSLGPGESTDVTIEFNSKKFNGNIRKVVHIESNDPLNPIVDIMISAIVHTPLIISPVSQRIGFSQSLRGETPSRRVTFTATGDEPLVISIDNTRKDLFDIEIINSLDGNPKMAAMDVTVRPDMAPGRQRDNVRVATNIPDFETLDIDLQSWISEELVASPQRLNYRFKKSLQQTIRIAPFRDGTTFQILSVDSDLPELEIDFLETIPNQEVKIIIKGHAIDKTDPRAVKVNGRMTGTITIRTNLKNTPQIEIPVTYMVRM
ncbi:MAG: hypothetical protein ACI9UK_000195 [Candidatus Krumholzibacteriia bacterium]|jgi:hypothetical protein